MKYNSLNNGPLELTTEGLFPIGERVSYRKSKFRHGRLGSVYVVEDNAAARSDAARCLADMLTDDDTEVYVVTDAPERYADVPADHVIDIADGATKLMDFCSEMEERFFTLMSDMQFTVDDYNAKHPDDVKKVMYIVVDAIDDYLDKTADIAYPLVRITQKGRSAGVNVVACSARLPANDYESLIRSNCMVSLWADGGK